MPTLPPVPEYINNAWVAEWIAYLMPFFSGPLAWVIGVGIAISIVSAIAVMFGGGGEDSVVLAGQKITGSELNEWKKARVRRKFLAGELDDEEDAAPSPSSPAFKKWMDR